MQSDKGTHFIEARFAKENKSTARTCSPSDKKSKKQQCDFRNSTMRFPNRDFHKHSTTSFFLSSNKVLLGCYIGWPNVVHMVSQIFAENHS